LSRLLRRTLYAVVIGALLYAAAMIWLDAGKLGAALERFPWWRFVLALLLSSANYLLRFAKWELSLGWLHVRRDAPGLTRARSLVVYLAGLSMSISPGKLGEVLRSALLKASDGIPFSRTAPIVVADRVTDLIALVVLSLVGVSRYREYLPVVLATAVLVAIGVFVLGTPRVLRPLLRRMGSWPLVGGIAARGELLVDSAAVVLRVRALLVLSAISVLGWGLECVGFWLVLGGFGVEASLPLCAFLWSVGTLVGALSFLPGGLVAAEGSLTLATMRLVAGATESIALASTVLARIATLWFGELVGGIALAVFLRDPELRRRAFAEGERGG
jgi:glycosyltransferase 2 family protein